jgi:hypothetical protein
MFHDQQMFARIFVRASFLEDPVAHLTEDLAGVGPKYSASGKFAGLRAILGADGDRPVTAVPAALGTNKYGRPTQLVFCAFNYDTNRETFFRSDAQSLSASFGGHLQVTVAEAINASANPPVNFFDAPAGLANQRARFWDGAVGGYNNPVLAAVIEATANADRYGTSAASIRALSIGTGNVVLPPASELPDEDPDLVAPRAKSTILADIKKMASSILDDPPDAASFHAHMMLGGRLPRPADDLPVDSPVVRLNPLIQPVKGASGAWELPPGFDREAFVAIRDMPVDALAGDQIDAIQSFGELWLAGVVPNQPIRANGDTLRAEIGHGRFQLAEAAAKARFP